MPDFAYKARNAEGVLVEGVLNCRDRGVAIRQIEQQNCIPIRIDAVMTAAPIAPGPAPPRNFVPKIFNRGPSERSDVPAQNLRIPHSQLLVFTEQLAHLQHAGMTLDEGLGVLGKRLKHPRVQQMIRTLHQALVDGRSFSQALREFPRIFPPLYVNLVAAGEASGALPEILMRLVKHLMQEKSLRDRVQQALIYPVFLALAGTGLIVIFITVMVPQLTSFMSQTGGTLPLATRALLGVHHFIVGYWWLFVLIAVGISVGFRAFVASEEGRLTWDRFRLSIPGYGRIRRH